MIDLIDLIRSIAAEAARAEENTNYPLPCTPGAPLLASVRQACVERGFTASGVAGEGVPATLAATPVLPVALPDGWKLVPVEPNDAMQAAGAQAVRIDTTVINKIWTGNAVFLAMIAAAPSAPAAQSGTTQAATDVLAERRRQVNGEGMTNDADDSYTHAELPFAAAAYILNGRNDEAPAIWPWSKAWWKPRGNRANYVRAGALILAEIERLDRAAAAEAVKP